MTTIKSNKHGISLFSGAGGMDVGFSKAGFKIILANDNDSDACKTYAKNHGNVVKHCDINDIFPDLRIHKDVDILFGGPPCQGFSVAGNMDPDDPRSQLIKKFMDAVELVRPRAFVCENVKALATLSKWASVRNHLIKKAIRLGYQYKLIVLNAADFGVPQSRERMFLIGFRESVKLIDFDSSFKQFYKKAPTVRDILLQLGTAGSPNNGRICRAKVSIAKNPILRSSPYAGMLFNGQGRPLNPDGHSSTLPATMGGNRTPIIDENHLYNNKPSWVERYHSHLMSDGKPLNEKKAPPYLRRLTIDEALRLQTFPNNYTFVGSSSSIYRQIGNAVPCRLAYVVASVMAKYLSA